MVVDDDETTLQVLCAALEDRGYHVASRNRSIGTSLAIARGQVDVVLLDVRMPALSGGRLARLLANQTDSSPIVILHSSMSRGELEALAEDSGAAGFIEKTGDIGIFIRRFEQAVADAQVKPRTFRPSGPAT
jgi:CheY-like chemotaxis protein